MPRPRMTDDPKPSRRGSDWTGAELVRPGEPHSSRPLERGTTFHVFRASNAPDEFLVTGVDASVSFHLPGRLPGQRMQILSAEEGTHRDGAWTASRLWNGDETDRGLQFPQDDPAIVRVKLGRF